MSDIEVTTDNDKSIQTLVSGLVGTVATINQTVFFLIAASFIGFLLASFPDLSWLDSSQSVELPFAGGAPIGLMIIVLPIVLVAAQAYLNFQLQHLRVIDKALANRLAIPPVLHPSQHAGVGFVTILIRYILVPLVLVTLAWKALPFQEKFIFLATTVLVSLLISFVALVNISNKFVVAAVVLICAVAITLAMGSPYYKSILGISNSQSHSYVQFYKKWLRRPLDLYLADLSKVDLLNDYDLEAANLIKANLSNAFLGQVNFTRANLRRATLTGADLSGASLNEADLYHADLSNSRLYFARFENADMECAKLEGADLGYADLSSARHLTRSQINKARSTENTKLPINLQEGPQNCD